jgi:hypothetical protein
MSIASWYFRGLGIRLVEEKHSDVVLVIYNRFDIVLKRSGNCDKSDDKEIKHVLTTIRVCH